MSAGALLRALPEALGAPHGPWGGLTAARLFHHLLWTAHPPSSSFLQDHSCSVVGAGPALGGGPETLLE